MLCTPLTFLLSGPDYGFNNTTIGLFGLAGAAGAYAANRFGRLADRGLGNQATRIGQMCIRDRAKRFGKDPFTGQERWFPAKPASVKVKVRPLKKLTAAAQ